MTILYSQNSKKILFVYLKNITIKEKRNVEDNAIKLIVKLSEGSVRDALSLLDRATISNNENSLTFEDAQKIFGYVNKSAYIELLEIIFLGDEEKIIDRYRKLYNSGIEPNLFLNDFLEILYYLKNISYIHNEGNNFNLNDSDYKKITSLSKEIDPNAILLFWEFTLKTLKEIKIAYDTAIKYGQQLQNSGNKNQVDLFSLGDNQSSLIKTPELKEIEEWDEKKSLSFEKEVLGMYVSGHPLLEHADEIEEFTSVDFSDDLMLKKNEIVTVGGMVTKITKKYDRRNRAMAFFEMDCFGGTVEVIAFSDCFEKYENLIEEDAVIFINGKMADDTNFSDLKVG